MCSASEDRVWFRHVRLRLVLVYVAVTGLLFAASFIVTLVLVRHAVIRQLSRELDRNRILFTDEYLHPVGPDRLAYVQKELSEEASEIGLQRLYALLVSPRGEVLASSPVSPDFRQAMCRFADAPGLNFTARLANGRLRRVRACVQRLPDGNRLVVGLDRTRIDEQLCDLFMVLSGVFLLVLLFSVAAGLAFAPFVTRAAETAFLDLERTTDAIAHDLRTPVTRLRGRAELALMRKDDAGLAGDVAEECAAMLEMINTMLNLAATETGIRGTPRERLDLAALVRSVVDLYAPAAEDKGVRLSATVPSAPVFFSGHRSKFQQLLGNLLDNAIKFTPAGGAIVVSLSSGAPIVLSVHDTGCGIGAADLPRVFERFYRADSARTIPGTGLGLALVKAIATSYGGSASADSKPGKGATIVVTLPGTEGI